MCQCAAHDAGVRCRVAAAAVMAWWKPGCRCLRCLLRLFGTAPATAIAIKKILRCLGFLLGLGSSSWSGSRRAGGGGGLLYNPIIRLRVSKRQLRGVGEELAGETVDEARRIKTRWFGRLCPGMIIIMQDEPRARRAEEGRSS